jgi:hypothetical protein
VSTGVRRGAGNIAFFCIIIVDDEEAPIIA